MYKKILIATDGSQLANKAVDHGLALAKELGSEVVAVTVKEPFLAPLDGSSLGGTSIIEAYENDSKEVAEKIFQKVTAKAHEIGVPCSTVYVRDQDPSEGIIETAKKMDCDLIIMASHGRRGMSRLLLGSHSLDVLTHSKTPVLIYR